MCTCVCVVQDRGTKEFHGRQFVCSSRNLLAKLHDHKLCSRNLFTCQRGRWRFNYTVVVPLSFFSLYLSLSFSVCDIGEIPGWLPRFLGAQQILRNEQKLASGKKKVHCHWEILFFGSEWGEGRISQDFWQPTILASAHLPLLRGRPTQQAPFAPPPSLLPLPFPSSVLAFIGRVIHDVCINTVGSYERVLSQAQFQGVTYWDYKIPCGDQ